MHRAIKWPCNTGTRWNHQLVWIPSSRRFWGRIWTRWICDPPKSEPCSMAATIWWRTALTRLCSGRLPKFFLVPCIFVFIFFHPEVSSWPLCKPSSLCLEVRVGDEVPAVLTPLKPKFVLLGSLAIPAKTAIKLLWKNCGYVHWGVRISPGNDGWVLSTWISTWNYILLSHERFPATNHCETMQPIIMKPAIDTWYCGSQHFWRGTCAPDRPRSWVELRIENLVSLGWNCRISSKNRLDWSRSRVFDCQVNPTEFESNATEEHMVQIFLCLVCFNTTLFLQWRSKMLRRFLMMVLVGLPNRIQNQRLNLLAQSGRLMILMQIFRSWKGHPHFDLPRLPHQRNHQQPSLRRRSQQQRRQLVLKSLERSQNQSPRLSPKVPRRRSMSAKDSTSGTTLGSSKWTTSKFWRCFGSNVCLKDFSFWNRSTYDEKSFSHETAISKMISTWLDIWDERAPRWRPDPWESRGDCSYPANMACHPTAKWLFPKMRWLFVKNLFAQMVMWLLQAPWWFLGCSLQIL